MSVLREILIQRKGHLKKILNFYPPNPFDYCDYVIEANKKNL